MGWADDILKGGDLALLEVSNEIKNTSIKFGNKIIDYSPTQVDAEYPGTYATGLFANSWYVGINNFDETVGVVADESASGSRARINGLGKEKVFFKEDDYISFSNNLSYAERVEYLGWPQSDGYTGFIGPYAPMRNSITWIQGELKA